MGPPRAAGQAMTAGFGLERLGLVTLRHPRRTAVVAVLVTLLAAFAAVQLPFESNIRDIFRSDSSDYAVLEELVAAYPASENDVVVVVEGDILKPASLAALRAFHLDTLLLDGVNGVVSLFSAYHPPSADGSLAPVVPADLASLEGAGDFDRLKAALLAQPVVANKLLSADGKLALVVISLSPDLDGLDHVRDRVQAIKATAGEDLGPSGLTPRYSGLPLIRLGVVDALQRDQEVFRVAGFVVGLMLTWLFFRRIGYVVIVAVPVLVAIVWQLGAMWLLGQSVNVLTAVVPTFVMVLTFSDGLHLLFAAQREQSAGKRPSTAIAAAMVSVGPAAALTSLTTMLAFITLALVPHPFVAGFGVAGALGSAVAFLAVILLFPPLALLVLSLSRGAVARLDRGVAGVVAARLSAGAASLALRRPVVITITAVILTAVSIALYVSNTPHYNHSENLPSNSEALAGLADIDARLAGSGVLSVYLTLAKGHDALDADSLAAIAAVHDVVAADPLIRATWSLKDVVDWYRSGTAPADGLADFLNAHRDRFARQVIGADGRTALVTGYFPNADASVLLPAVDRIDAALDAVRAAHPGLSAVVTGFDVVAARASTDMIAQLNISLLAAVGVIIVVIGIALRSLRAGLIGLLPNVLPIALGGAFLYVAGFGLQFTSVIAFTISFGIAVDSTIHMFNRYRLATLMAPSTEDALRETLLTIGPVLIVSTVVLVLGLGTTITSLLPTVRLYGYVSVLVLVAALAADLLVLPAMLLLVARWSRRHL